MSPALKVFIGFDPRQRDAALVAERSLRRHSSIRLDVQLLVLEHLQAKGLYTRPTERRDGRLWDVISDAPMSTEFALTRFLVPVLAGYEGWALYFDCDFLWRDDVASLLEFGRQYPERALLCVPHQQKGDEQQKMDGQAQTHYERKNWSSLMLWNCGHLLHAGMQERVARWPGLWLHQMKWTKGYPDIGFLPETWNWLEGVSLPNPDPCAVHFTRGLPSVPGYENAAFANEWREELADASGKVAA